MFGGLDLCVIISKPRVEAWGAKIQDFETAISSGAEQILTPTKESQRTGNYASTMVQCAIAVMTQIGQWAFHEATLRSNFSVRVSYLIDLIWGIQLMRISCQSH